MAEGIGGGLRQRINRGKHETIPTRLHTISTYEELNRLLAGRINIIEFVDKIRRSFEEKRMNTITILSMKVYLDYQHHLVKQEAIPRISY